MTELPTIDYFTRPYVAGKAAGEVIIDYTNHRGTRRERTIIPQPGTFRFESNEYHPVPQWLFDALDVEKGVRRTFALQDVHSWRDVVP